VAWEKRERGSSYYTRSRKVDGRVIRKYVGGGVLGEIAALEDAYERRRREEEAAYWKEQRKRLAPLMAPVEELCEAAQIFAQAHLVAGGYRRTGGHWRRRRESA
jgi:hypothetical protein